MEQLSRKGCKDVRMSVIERGHRGKKRIRKSFKYELSDTKLNIGAKTNISAKKD